ncbi:MAG: hypothetical protein ACMUHY_06815 [Thermoplasmatota archaeon]
MNGRYLDMDNINHLIEQAGGGGAYDDRLWRESYYFNMTDHKSGLGLITTIGQLPNRRRSAGFLLLIKHGDPVLLRPLVSLARPVFTDHRIEVGCLSYSVQGIDWLLRYNDGRTSIDVRFTPINRIYAYRKDVGEETELDRIATQHYEQFGAFNGSVSFRGSETEIENGLGHRDHSWGIRDWGSVDRYSLHCCAFSREFAFNLWEGSIRGRSFLKGFVFDGENNLDVIRGSVQTGYRPDGRVPESSRIRVEVASDRKFDIVARSVMSVQFPPPGAIIQEGMARMSCGNLKGCGLQEYLRHSPGRLERLPAYFRLLFGRRVRV